MDAKIITAATMEAKYSYTTPEILEKLDLWLGNQPDRIQKMVARLTARAAVDRRSSILPLEALFSDMSFEEKNDHYISSAIEMAEEVLSKALAQAELTPKDIDFIVTTSCTGFMIPSVDAYLVDRLGMRNDVVRLPVTEMGCAGGTAGLIYADQYLRANPGKNVAVIALEIPSITLQKDDLSMDNLVSAAIFGDGAACVILGPTSKIRPKILDSQMYHFPDTAKLMGFNLQNTGLKIVLDKDIPAQIQEHFNHIVFPFLEKNSVRIEEVNNFIFHPGGKKIVNMVEQKLERHGKNIEDSKEVLRIHGNMSSATVLFILGRFLNKNIEAEEKGLMLAFGPGFTAQSLLLEWA